MRPAYALARTILGAAVVVGAAAADGGEGLRASIDAAAGVPRLALNGEPVAPLMLFVNWGVPGERSERVLREQVELAANAGIHLYSFPFSVPHVEGRPDYTRLENVLQTIVGIDPAAQCLVRINPGPRWDWDIWADLEDEHLALFADGTRNRMSIGSPYYWDVSNEALRRTIEHFESGPWVDHIYGYQIGGPDSENFMDSYREKGPDISPANTARFRQWLERRYGDDAALQEAWGRNGVTLATAEVPRDPARFPMRGAGPGEVARIFYEVPREQDWIDYSRYGNWITSERILDWARLVKDATAGRKLAAFFYGYLFDLNGSFSGHNQLSRVLASPDVDILASPFSYTPRGTGDPASFMSPVDSITAHGKLWYSEDDTRTTIVRAEQVWEPMRGLWWSESESIEETQAQLDRNLGSALVHNSGTWWMDLVGAGMFNHPAYWEVMAARKPFFERRVRNPRPYRPEVAVLLDEDAEAVVRSDWDATFRHLLPLRNDSERTGTTIGFYLLQDFAAGIVPECDAYVFANAFTLTDDEIAAIRARLNREQATAIWMYAPGCFGPEGFDAARAEAACGIALADRPGRQGSAGAGLLDGLAWGWDHEVTPRTVVDDPDAAVLGRYGDGAVSAARRQVGTHTAVFLGDLTTSPYVLRRLYADAGAHIWADGGEVVRSDGEYLVVHRGRAGTVDVHLPATTAARRLDAAGGGLATGSATLRFEGPGTRWLRLHPAGG